MWTELAGPYSGIVDAMPPDVRDRAEAIVGSRARSSRARTSAASAAGDGSLVVVPCLPLHDIVSRGLGRRTVDYWSLDTEGSEARILNATDFGPSGVEVGVLSVEHNSYERNHRRIHRPSDPT